MFVLLLDKLCKFMTNAACNFVPIQCQLRLVICHIKMPALTSAEQRVLEQNCS